MSRQGGDSRRWPTGLVALIAALTWILPAHAASAGPLSPAKPTVVLVHGAWADPSGWAGVAGRLRQDGFPVVVPSLGLRSLPNDVAAVRLALAGISGPIVLVGHSYGGAVITNAAAGNPNVVALAYIAAFMPDMGESVLGLSTKNLGSSLPLALVPVPSFGPSGLAIDLYINPLLFRYVFTSNEVDPINAAAMAAAQRPVTVDALSKQSAAAAWRSLPSWFLVAGDDHAIPPATQRFEAQRAGSHTVEIKSGHAAMVSHPDAVAALVRSAAGQP